MAKNMARIENGVVVNIEWASDSVEETAYLLNIYDHVVEIGDIYSDGSFYRNGELLLSPLEKALSENYEYKEALTILGVDV